MIKRIVEYLICLILANTTLFIKENSNCINELEIFSNYLKSDGYKVEKYEDVVVVFDYDKIENYIENNLNKTSINKVSEMSFSLTMSIKTGIFFKEMKKEFYIKKGDLYVDRN